MNRLLRLKLTFWLVSAVLILALVSGCGGSSVKREAAPTPPAAKTAPTASAPADTPTKLADSRKVIETAQISLETRDLPATEKLVMQALDRRKGKLDSTNVSMDGDGRRTGNYSLRVPSGALQGLVDDIAGLPDVVVRQRSISSQDVTEDFIDSTARLENMQRQEVRLREILARANTVDEVLKVEKELATVRGQIESATGRLKAMSGRIEMSTVKLRISEVTLVTEANFFGKLRAILRDSWVNAGDVLLYLIASVIVLSPLILLVALAVWFWRRRKKTQRPFSPPPDRQQNQ